MTPPQATQPPSEHPPTTASATSATSDPTIAKQRGPERALRSLVIAGAIVGLLSGAALGVLWWRLAPRVPIVIQPDGSRPQGFQPEEYLAADIAFAAIALVAGVILTIALAAMRRQHLLGVLTAGLVASALGTAAMWQVGTRLGSVDIEGLVATTDVEFVVDAPLDVTMPGVYLVWAIASATVVAVLALSDLLVSYRANRAR